MAIFEQVQKLLLREAAEVPLPEDGPPSEVCTLSDLQVNRWLHLLLLVKKGKVWERLALAGAAVVVGTGIVGCGIHPPDLNLPAVAPAWRPTANTTHHFTTVGFSIGAVFIVYYSWSTIARGSQQGLSAIRGRFR